MSLYLLPVPERLLQVELDSIRATRQPGLRPSLRPALVQPLWDVTQMVAVCPSMAHLQLPLRLR